MTLVDIDWDLLAFDGYPSASKIIASVALTFFAYLGFNVITFTVGDLKDPARELPKAMYSALGVYVGDLRAHRARRVRRPDRFRGDRLRGDRDRRGRPPRAGRRGLHGDGDRRAARDVELGERDAVRLGEPDCHARQAAAVPPVLRSRLTDWARAPASTSPRRSCSSSPTSSTCRRSRRSAAPSRWSSSCSSAPRATGAEPTPAAMPAIVLAAIGGDRDRARVLRRRHAPTRLPETFGAIIAIGLLSIILDALVRRRRPGSGSPEPPDRDTLMG